MLAHLPLCSYPLKTNKEIFYQCHKNGYKEQPANYLMSKEQLPINHLI